jgi:hypothetical protein
MGGASLPTAIPVLNARHGMPESSAEGGETRIQEARNLIWKCCNRLNGSVKTFDFQAAAIQPC